MASGVKRSLFSKPAWAATSVSKKDPNKDTDSIFGRNVAYDEIVRAQKAERERKAAKAQARNERQKNKESSKDRSEEPESKKRKISTEPDGLDDWDSDGVRKEKPRQKPVTRSTPKKEQALYDPDATPETPHSRRRRSGKATMISLDGDDEDDDLIMLTPPKPKGATPKKSKLKSKDDVDGDDSSEEDEYLRELKERAREKARLQRDQGSQAEKDKRTSTPISRANSAALEVNNAQSSSVPQDQGRPSSSNSPTLFATSNQLPPTAQPPENDPEIKILIHSKIPSAKSLIVKRKASQSLKQVKEFWCRKFDLEDSVARQVFFTWNGTRLFDSTTMRGIIRGLKKDHYQKQRSFSLDGDEEADGAFDERSAKDPSNGNILLEAMTQEIYDRKLREKERQQQEDATGDEETPESEGEKQATAPAVDENAIIIRLVSNNKELEPMQLRVRPHTTVGKIMRGYAATRKVEEGKTPWLIYDGERLDPETTVEELGLEDEEQVEVSIR
ncbi:hypothetical protein H2200_009253 [Cladophialophora chaetospira]|uniref:Ubiquitin-like domain-containing protein n=1 Tax=Cladophialophora chaetospira TaxID=386627 RepID=A0AA39CFI9_9EURO|nr:hypothetical protein H2200_009253 [Cladophialophora chaetospira]